MILPLIVTFYKRFFITYKRYFITKIRKIVTNLAYHFSAYQYFDFNMQTSK